MSVSSAALRKLSLLKLSAEQMAGVLDILADQAQAEEDRKALQRDRTRRHREKRDGNVTETLQGCDTPPSDKEIPPTPPKEINSPRETTRARGTRLPDDWVLPASWGRWAVSEGHSEAAIRLEAEKFSDFWHAKSGKDASKLDWEATWRNWMRNVPKHRSSGTAPPKPKSEFMQHQDDVQRELDKALGRKRDDEFTGSTIELEAGNWRPH